MAKIELIKTVSCPRLEEQEIPIEKCEVCRFHLGVKEKHRKVMCSYP